MEIEIVNSVSKLLPFEANEGINHESGPGTIWTPIFPYFFIISYFFQSQFFKFAGTLKFFLVLQMYLYYIFLRTL